MVDSGQGKVLDNFYINLKHSEEILSEKTFLNLNGISRLFFNEQQNIYIYIYIYMFKSSITKLNQ